MAKNKIIAPERTTKRDKFFKKPKQTSFQTQRHYKNDNKSPGNESQSSSSFFIKKNDYNTRDTPSQSKEAQKDDKPKKPFDKKKWRLQRYSKKYKLQQWEENRKKVILREYYRETKDNSDPKINVQKIYEEAEQEDSDLIKIGQLENENNLNSEIVNDDNSEHTKEVVTRNKRKPRLNAYQEFQRLKDEKKRKKEEIQQKKEERDKALKEYKKEKTRKYKKLNKKTSKGQPVMKYRMQMLLEQIQKSVSN
ncbi:rrna processing [Holotrichia oblita]|uniref:Rrna processing n=1 Tax=Holotrichia oblita TaxID=644536 RepID=A0ACB9TPG8_HOLOL|nr:rrna processing [Holotrichia oblita]